MSKKSQENITKKNQQMIPKSVRSYLSSFFYPPLFFFVFHSIFFFFWCCLCVFLLVRDCSCFHSFFCFLSFFLSFFLLHDCSSPSVFLPRRSKQSPQTNMPFGPAVRVCPVSATGALSGATAFPRKKQTNVHVKQITRGKGGRHFLMRETQKGYTPIK